MAMDTPELERLVCRALCTEATVTPVRENLWRVAMPFKFPDGDSYTLYLKRLVSGGVRISDAGSTLMHLSYENDLDKLREGTRGRLLQQVLADSDVEEDEGEFFIEASLDEIGKTLFRFGQALTRVHDLTFLNRLRIESTFYEDLREVLREIVGADRIQEGYVVPDVPRGGDYPVDYFIEGRTSPVYLFGVPSRDKAQLATIILQHLIGAGKDFNSLIVFQNMADLPRAYVSRLTNAANDQVDSLDALNDLKRKLLRRVA